MADKVITIKFKGDEKDVIASIGRIESAAKRLNFTNFGGRVQSTTTNANNPLRQAQAEIKKYQNESIRAERELTRQIEREARQQAQIRAREARRGANDLIKEIERVKREEKELSRARTGGGSSFLGSFAGNVAATAFVGVTAGATEAAKAIFNYSASLQSTELAFQNLIGNAGKAKQFLKELQEFAKETPFEFQGISDLAQRLLGANVQLEKVKPLLKDIGNVVAGTGKITQERFEGIAVAITQIISKQKVQAEEMEQLAERGVPAWQILSEAIGKSVAETRKLSEQGQITSDVLVAALQKVSREKFGDAMAKQATVGLTGLTKARESIIRAAATFFNPLYQEITKTANRFNIEIQKQGNDLRGIGVVVAKYIGEGLGLGIETVLSSFGSYIGTRLKEIFTEGKIIDPITKGLFGGLSRGITNGLGLTQPEQQSQAPRTYDYARPGSPSAAKTDNIFSNLSANTSKLERERTARIADELQAQINLYQNQLSQVEKIYKDSYDKITDIFKESNDPNNFQANFDRLKQWYGEQINELVPIWEELVRKQTLADQKGQFEQLEIYRQTQQRKQELSDLTLQLEDNAVKLQKEIRQKASEESIRNAEETVQKLIQLSDKEVQTRVKNLEFLSATGATPERNAIEEINALYLKALEARKNGYQQLLEFVRGNAEKEKEIQQELKVLDYEISQQKIDNAKRVFDTKAREQEKEAELYRDFQQAVSGLDLEINDLNNQLGISAELSRADAVAKQLQTGEYKNLTQAQKDLFLQKAQEVDQLKNQIAAQNLIREQYEQTRDTVRDMLGILTDSSQSFGDRIKNLFSSIADRFKQMLLDMFAEWITSKIFKSFFGGGSQNGTSGGFSLGNIFGGSSSGGFGSIFGGNAGGGIFNFGGNAFTGGGTSSTVLPTSPGFGQNIRNLAGFGNLGAGNQTGIGAIFGKGGIFGDKGFGANLGTVGGLGAIASIIGGFIPGKAGSVISSTGGGVLTGLQIGGLFGPIGAGIGAAVGGLIGFFSSIFGSAKRKRDAKEKLPALQQNFKEALQTLKELAGNKNAILSDPQGAISQGESLFKQISTNFGIVAESSKYRKQFEQMRQQNTATAKIYLDKIKEFAKQAEASASRPILPEFKDGGAVSNFMKNYHGLVPGVYDRKDDKLIRVSGNEVVLTPNVWQPITPYLKEKKVPGFANGGYVGTGAVSGSNITVSPQITIVMRGDITAQVEDVIISNVTGEKGVKITKENIRVLAKNNEVTGVRVER